MDRKAMELWYDPEAELLEVIVEKGVGLAEDAAKVTDAALENLPADGAEPAYEIWRQRIQAQFARATITP